MSLLIGALTMGLVLALLALAIYLTFRVFGLADITVDGSLTLGAAVTATLIVHGWSPFASTLGGGLCGALAGAVTGLLHTRFRIHHLLAGILVMTALYSVNLHVMGKSNLPLLSEKTLATQAEAAALTLLGGEKVVAVAGWEVEVRDLATLAGAFLVAAFVAAALWLFLRTRLGAAMRATGDNAQMIRAAGVDTRTMLVLGFVLSNGLVGLCGALLAQVQGFADVQMGIGMIVWGLASVIIGESLVRSTSLGLALSGAVIGSVLFRLLVAIALRWGLDPNDLKLVTAAFVFLALVLPGLGAGAKKAEADRA